MDSILSIPVSVSVPSVKQEAQSADNDNNEVKAWGESLSGLVIDVDSHIKPVSSKELYFPPPFLPRETTECGSKELYYPVSDSSEVTPVEDVYIDDTSAVSSITTFHSTAPIVTSPTASSLQSGRPNSLPPLNAQLSSPESTQSFYITLSDHSPDTKPKLVKYKKPEWMSEGMMVSSLVLSSLIITIVAPWWVSILTIITVGWFYRDFVKYQ